MRAIIMMAGLLCALESANAQPRTQWLAENASIPACDSVKTLRRCSASDAEGEEMYRLGHCKRIRGPAKWHYLASGGMLGDVAFVRFSPADGSPSSTGWVHAKALEDRSLPNKPSTKAKALEQADERRTCSE